MTTKKKVTKRTKRTQSKRRVNPVQLQKQIEKQIDRIHHIEAGITASTWKLADEVLKLAELIRKKTGRPASASKLRNTLKIDRDGSRLVLYTKLAKFFPAHLRQAGVGLRVYEVAWKTNQRLRMKGFTKLTAQEIADLIGEECKNAWKIEMRMEDLAREREGKALHEEKVRLVDQAASAPKAAIRTPKKWMKLIDTQPYLAIAAALSTHGNDDSVGRVNQELEGLRCPWRICSEENLKRINDSLRQEYFARTP